MFEQQEQDDDNQMIDDFYYLNHPTQMGSANDQYKIEPAFDVKGKGYDEKSARGAGVYNKDEFGHYPSRVPETGLLLKGRGHETYDKMLDEEKDMGFEVYEKGGRDYSKATPQRQAFDRIIGNAPHGMASVARKTEGRINYGLFTYMGDDSTRKYVMSDVDKWHRDPDLSIEGSLHKGAVSRAKEGKFIDEKKAWKMYESMSDEDWEDKVMRVLAPLKRLWK